MQSAYPQVEAVMIGRGLIARPDMLSGKAADAQTLIAFYDALLQAYLSAFGGSRNAMFRMKEQWGMVLGRFDCGEKLKKCLRKTTDLAEYRQIVKEIFQTLTVEK
jgi:tRNA-dihydrouridine synthase